MRSPQIRFFFSSSLLHPLSRLKWLCATANLLSSFSTMNNENWAKASQVARRFNVILTRLRFNLEHPERRALPFKCNFKALVDCTCNRVATRSVLPSRIDAICSLSDALRRARKVVSSLYSQPFLTQR